MRFIYVIIGVFLVWCWLAAQWYLFWIKGLSPQPENIDPHESGMAIAEILLIIIISVLLGYVLAWLLQQESIKSKERTLLQLQEERSSMEGSDIILKEQLEKTEAILTKARETFREDFITVSRENEKLKTELSDAQTEVQLQADKLIQLKSETDEIGSRLRQEELAKGKLLGELESLKKEREKQPQQPAEKQLNLKAKAGEKDDLKVITGIGPRIEKRLNAAGIYSYRQISEFTEESIEKITKTIRFFPGRIERDRWVEQASKLYLDKLRK